MTMNLRERLAFRIFVSEGLTHAIGTPELSWQMSKDKIVGKECFEKADIVLESVGAEEVIAKAITAFFYNGPASDTAPSGTLAVFGDEDYEEQMQVGLEGTLDCRALARFIIAGGDSSS